jgi:nucleotide-binding universal stress UspA family protein
VIIHVLEESLRPGHKPLLRELLGEHYSTVQSRKEDQAKAVLIGKEKEAFRLRKAMEEWFQHQIVQTGDPEQASLTEDIVIRKGDDMPEEILAVANERDCDMIVMGLRSGRQKIISRVSGKIGNQSFWHLLPPLEIDHNVM